MLIVLQVTSATVFHLGAWRRQAHLACSGCCWHLPRIAGSSTAHHESSPYPGSKSFQIPAAHHYSNGMHMVVTKARQSAILPQRPGIRAFTAGMPACLQNQPSDNPANPSHLRWQQRPNPHSSHLEACKWVVACGCFDCTDRELMPLSAAKEAQHLHLRCVCFVVVQQLVHIGRGEPMQPSSGDNGKGNY